MEPKQVNGLNLASPVKRILATLVDAIVAGIITWLVTLPFGTASTLAQVQSLQSENPTDIAALTAASQGTSFISGLLSLAIWVVVFLIVPIFVWKGQTIGKKLLKLKIVTEDGKVAEQNDILKRYSIYLGINVLNLIPFLNCISGCAALILPFVNLVMLFTDEKRQTVLDKVGKTLVIEE